MSETSKEGVVVSFESAEVFLASRGFPVARFEIIPLCFSAAYSSGFYVIEDCFRGVISEVPESSYVSSKNAGLQTLRQYAHTIGCSFLVSLRILSPNAGTYSYTFMGSGLKEKKDV